MRLPTLALGFLIGATVFIGASLVLAWTGPTSAPPSGNVAAPINTGSVDQIKSGGLGLDALAVFGNAILSGTNRYLNFGDGAGETGYGIRDNNGTMEFKNSGASWQRMLSPSSTFSQIEFADGTTQTTASTGITENVTVSCAFSTCTATCPPGYFRTGCSAKYRSGSAEVSPSGSNACYCSQPTIGGGSGNTCYAFCAK